MAKIIINRCYGGFSVNDDVAKLLKLDGVKVTFAGEYYPDGVIIKSNVSKNHHYFDNEDFGIIDDNYDKWRADERLIKAIETIGEDKSYRDDISEIEIIENPDDVEWEIDDYDGIETIHEKHRSW